MPGSATVRSRRWRTFAAVMPVGSSVASVRCGFSPNSGQSASRGAAATDVLAAASAQAPTTSAVSATASATTLLGVPRDTARA